MYDLSNSYSNAFEVMYYTITAMKEVGFSKDEIDEYMLEATSSDNTNLIDVSMDYVSKCNEYTKAYNDDLEYYEFDTSNYYNNLEDEDDYNGYSYNQKKFGFDSDEECYEGFDSCKNHYYSFNDLDEQPKYYRYNWDYDDDTED